jgi:hypothetical protein
VYKKRRIKPTLFPVSSLMSLPPSSIDRTSYPTVASRAPSVDSVKCVMAFAIHIQRARRAVYFHFCPASGRALQRPTRFFLARRRAFRVPTRSIRSNLNQSSNGPKSPKREGTSVRRCAQQRIFLCICNKPAHINTHSQGPQRSRSSATGARSG